ncbi:hypothetical protein GOEFS_108_00070 [Gordonia effusa NBRC 100432]|uniref:Uncharacterized protein n=1 Tax=Gordonia effusa NBRC 100432 TaxID=1077974 RepID=H0R596_9ACTN|nr:hypothetical protein [Gordonia effusa]GAB20247.1 hypothetical protein GOEFS_108_00070 [Gordonia effusa NBRC 100432]
MAQIRRRPKKVDADDPPIALTTTSENKPVTINTTAAQGLGAGRTGMAPRGPQADLTTIGYEQTRQAARAAGRTPPSPRTFRRWKQTGRIPHRDVADLVARHAEITRLGGVDQAAATIGRSPSAVRKWQAGKTHSMLPDASARRSEQSVNQRIVESGIPSGARPRITFTASVHARWEGGDYDYRQSRSFAFGPGSPELDSMDSAAVSSLAHALASDDYDRATAIIEEHASTNYGSFGGFDDDTGFHFESISDLRITWD